MQSMDVLLDGSNLGRNNCILPSKNSEAHAGDRWDPVIFLGDDLQQFGGTMATLRRYDTEFRHMPTDRVRQHRALTDQELAAAMQHQGRLLLLGFRRYKPHRRSSDRLADRGGIVSVVLAALEIGLHVARRHQPYRVAQRLKLTAPMVSGWTCLNTNQARRQCREELQHLHSVDALADHDHATSVNAMNLDFAMSRPIVLTSPMDGSPHVVAL